jgi:hypothetical protein
MQGDDPHRRERVRRWDPAAAGARLAGRKEIGLPTVSGIGPKDAHQEAAQASQRQARSGSRAIRCIKDFRADRWKEVAHVLAVIRSTYLEAAVHISGSRVGRIPGTGGSELRAIRSRSRSITAQSCAFFFGVCPAYLALFSSYRLLCRSWAR